MDRVRFAIVATGFTAESGTAGNRVFWPWTPGARIVPRGGILGSLRRRAGKEPKVTAIRPSISRLKVTYCFADGG